MKIVKIAALIIFFYFIAVPSAHAAIIIQAPKYIGLNSGLVGWWTFDGKDMANLTAYDRSGQGNNGRYWNATGTKPVIGKLGQALSFDGVASYVNATVASSLQSISFWIKANNLTSKIIDLLGDTASIEVKSGFITANGFTNPLIYVDTASTTLDTNWHHVVVTTNTAITNGTQTTVRSSSNGSASSGTAVSVAAPSGTTAGDLVIVVVHANGQTTIVDNNGATPFTEDLNDYKPNPTNGQTLSLFSRRIVSGDPSTYNFTIGASGRWTAVAVTLQNPNASTIYDVAATQGNNRDDTTTNTGTSIGITTLTNNAIHFAVLGPDGSLNTCTATPSGYTAEQNVGDQPICLAYKVIASPGATGAQSFTYTSNNNYAAFSFAIKNNLTASNSVDIGRIGSGYFGGVLDDVRLYNRPLSADEIKRLYRIGGTLHVNTQINNDSLAKGLVGWWTFDGKDMAGVTAYDRSGNANNGTLTNGPTRVIGKLGQALNFDGVNDRVDLGGPASLNISGTNPRSVSAWVKYTTLVDFSAIVFAENLSGKALYNFGLNNGSNFRFGVEEAAAQPFANGSTDLVVGTWYHAVGTYDGINLRIYVNGILEGTTAATGGSFTLAGMAIGDKDSFSPRTNGLIDDVRIYNRALSGDEIRRLYNLGK